MLILLEKPDIKALRLNGEKWYEIDDIQDLNNAETIFAEPENKLLAYQKRYGGYWRYPHLTDFCYLVNPFFPTDKLKTEIRANFDTLIGEYPSGLHINCLLAAKNFSINQNYIVVGNGAAELINTYFDHCSLTTGIILPTFEEYANRIKQGKAVYYNPANPDFSYSADDLIEFFSQNTVDQLILINPDNPSGNYISLLDLFALLNWTKSNGIRIIIDESFVDFSAEGHSSTLLDNDILEKYPGLVVIKSISKSYGIPGLRLGIAASADADIIGLIKTKLPIWNINSLAEFFMQVFAKYEHDYLSACNVFKKERTRFYNHLKRIKYLRIIPSHANYFLCEVKGAVTALELTDILLTRYNILIKDCSGKAGFNRKNYVRIAVRNNSDNDTLAKALKEIGNENNSI